MPYFASAEHEGDRHGRIGERIFRCPTCSRSLLLRKPRPESDMSDGLSPEEIGHLARLYWSVEAALDVLVESGMPHELVSAVSHDDDVLTFWEEVSDLLEDGVIQAGRARLLDVVRRRYPGNALFSERSPEPSTIYRSERDIYVIKEIRGDLHVSQGPGELPGPQAAERVLTSVFFVGASPFDIDLGRLRADREFLSIQREERPGVLRAVSRTATNVTDLAALLEERPDVLHLACRASDGVLRFEDPHGGPHLVPAEALARRLRGYHDHADFTLSGLVLSAGRSAEFANLFDGLVQTVVTWNNDLDDECAVAFSAAMYKHLVQSSVRSLGAAARVAAEEVGGEDAECRNLPEQLYVRSM
ncbi:effector-associated domain EAD1-containing protein [Lentzea sp. CA-135723]|uniref:effector-associated domain EAD1-containing protein n=1 Tax=Lentzea sp. CA-135723 TaxID=3239950 RepID=UPI003D90A5C6